MTIANICPIHETIGFLEKKWNLLILLELYRDESSWKRYKIIKNRISDITPKILSQRLKELEGEGLIDKKIDASSFPIKCEYKLTESGRDFMKIIEDIKSWSVKWNVKSFRGCETSCYKCGILKPTKNIK